MTAAPAVAPAPPVAAPAPALSCDDADEVFELVDAGGAVVGRAPRGECHARGLLHRAVYVWVFDAAGRVLLQRRSPRKRIGAGQWDLSAAEHLAPGESFAAAAARGLAEELGIKGAGPRLVGPLAPPHRRELRVGDYHDAELVVSFKLENFQGDVAPDGVEVDAVRWAALAEVAAEAEAAPGALTPWLREEGASLGWFAS
jgi:isopentenyl-diphosphate delta-isomerase